MKQFWFGLGLLAVVLVSGIWVTHIMEKSHLPGAVQLQQAAKLVLEENWDGAEELAENVQKNWEDHWRMTAAIANHGTMDEIDALFAQLEVYESSRDKISYGAVCAHLSELLEALGKEHGFNWWNLL